MAQVGDSIVGEPKPAQEREVLAAELGRRLLAEDAWQPIEDDQSREEPLLSDDAVQAYIVSYLAKKQLNPEVVMRMGMYLYGVYGVYRNRSTTVPVKLVADAVPSAEDLASSVETKDQVENTITSEELEKKLSLAIVCLVVVNKEASIRMQMYRSLIDPDYFKRETPKVTAKVTTIEGLVDLLKETKQSFFTVFKKPIVALLEKQAESSATAANELAELYYQAWLNSENESEADIAKYLELTLRYSESAMRLRTEDGEPEPLAATRICTIHRSLTPQSKKATGSLDEEKQVELAKKIKDASKVHRPKLEQLLPAAEILDIHFNGSRDEEEKLDDAVREIGIKLAAEREDLLKTSAGQKAEAEQLHKQQEAEAKMSEEEKALKKAADRNAVTAEREVRRTQCRPAVRKEKIFTMLVKALAEVDSTLKEQKGSQVTNPQVRKLIIKKAEYCLLALAKLWKKLNLTQSDSMLIVELFQVKFTPQNLQHVLNGGLVVPHFTCYLAMIFLDFPEIDNVLNPAPKNIEDKSEVDPAVKKNAAIIDSMAQWMIYHYSELSPEMQIKVRQNFEDLNVRENLQENDGPKGHVLAYLHHRGLKPRQRFVGSKDPENVHEKYLNKLIVIIVRLLNHENILQSDLKELVFKYREYNIWSSECEKEVPVCIDLLTKDFVKSRYPTEAIATVHAFLVLLQDMQDSDKHPALLNDFARIKEFLPLDFAFLVLKKNAKYCSSQYLTQWIATRVVVEHKSEPEDKSENNINKDLASKLVQHEELVSRLDPSAVEQIFSVLKLPLSDKIVSLVKAANPAHLPLKLRYYIDFFVFGDFDRHEEPDQKPERSRPQINYADYANCTTLGAVVEKLTQQGHPVNISYLAHRLKEAGDAGFYDLGHFYYSVWKLNFKKLLLEDINSHTKILVDLKEVIECFDRKGFYNFTTVADYQQLILIDDELGLLLSQNLFPAAVAKEIAIIRFKLKNNRISYFCLHGIENEEKLVAERLKQVANTEVKADGQASEKNKKNITHELRSAVIVRVVVAAVTQGDDLVETKQLDSIRANDASLEKRQAHNDLMRSADHLFYYLQQTDYIYLSVVKAAVVQLLQTKFSDTSTETTLPFFTMSTAVVFVKDDAIREQLTVAEKFVFLHRYIDYCSPILKHSPPKETPEWYVNGIILFDLLKECANEKGFDQLLLQFIVKVANPMNKDKVKKFQIPLLADKELMARLNPAEAAPALLASLCQCLGILPKDNNHLIFCYLEEQIRKGIIKADDLAKVINCVSRTDNESGVVSKGFYQHLLECAQVQVKKGKSGEVKSDSSSINGLQTQQIKSDTSAAYQYCCEFLVACCRHKKVDVEFVISQVLDKSCPYNNDQQKQILSVCLERYNKIQIPLRKQLAGKIMEVAQATSDLAIIADWLTARVTHEDAAGADLFQLLRGKEKTLLQNLSEIILERSKTSTDAKSANKVLACVQAHNSMLTEDNPTPAIKLYIQDIFWSCLHPEVCYLSSEEKEDSKLGSEVKVEVKTENIPHHETPTARVERLARQEAESALRHFTVQYRTILRYISPRHKNTNGSLKPIWLTALRDCLVERLKVFVVNWSTSGFQALAMLQAFRSFELFIQQEEQPSSVVGNLPFVAGGNKPRGGLCDVYQHYLNHFENEHGCAADLIKYYQEQQRYSKAEIIVRVCINEIFSLRAEIGILETEPNFFNANPLLPKLNSMLLLMNRLKDLCEASDELAGVHDQLACCLQDPAFDQKRLEALQTLNKLIADRRVIHLAPEQRL